MNDMPKPHFNKLEKCKNNPQLPIADKLMLTEVFIRYKEWIQCLNAVSPEDDNPVEKLVQATNIYKRFVEIDFIFDSSEDFLYRQKGQLKVDNTILEEFLPYLLYRSLKGLDGSFKLGPMNTFSGLSFLSSLSNTGKGGEPVIRSKNQDFILGKKLYLKTSFDKDFKNKHIVQSHLGYVCAECKTNLDKTMYQEAVATSRDLKIAVPSSLYFLVCEYLDMTPVSIVSTQIDDVLIVRRSRRIPANIRKKYSKNEQRLKHRSEYVDFIDKTPYCVDVFQKMIDRIQTNLDIKNPDVDAVLKQGYF